MSDSIFSRLLLLAISILFGLISVFLINRILKKLIKDNSYEIVWLKLLKKTTPPLVMLIIIISLSIIFPFDQLDNLRIEFSTVVTVTINIAIAWLVIAATKGIRLIVMSNYDLTSKDNLKARKIHTQLIIIERILIVLVLFVVLSITLLSFPAIRKIGLSLLASASIAGIIIGFAAQKSIAMFLAGFQIAFTQPIRLDDVVVVEKEWGRIEEITLTYVVIRIWDKRRLVVPISYFIENSFQNWTRTSAEIIGSVYIYVDYGFPVEDLRTELTRILEQSDEWDKQVNVLQVTDANNQNVELRALMSTPDSAKGWDLRVLVREKLILFIQREYPQYLPKSRVLIQDKA